MSNKESLDKLVQKKYQELSAALGDAHFRIKKTHEQIRKIEEEIESLNSAYPIASQIMSQANEDSSDDEQ